MRIEPSEKGAAKPAAKPSAPEKATVFINHATRGCHVLSVSGSAVSSTTATLKLRVGGVLTVQDNDIMPHTLRLVSGPQTMISSAAMTHMGATSVVRFEKAGTYAFVTKAGEDYKNIKNVKTVGADNHLKLKVHVA